MGLFKIQLSYTEDFITRTAPSREKYNFTFFCRSTLDISEFENLYGSLAAVFDGGRLGDTAEARLGNVRSIFSIPQYPHLKMLFILATNSLFYSWVIQNCYKFRLM